MSTHTLLRAAAALLLPCVACGDPPPSEYPTQQVHLEDTSLGPGDVFEVRVFRHKDLSGPYKVSSEGTITFPLVGVVEVSGSSPQQVEHLLTQRLADGYLVDPQVSLLVTETHSKNVSVIGQVRRPGRLPFADGMTVVDAVAQAGGFSALARKNAVTVTRLENGEKTTYTVPVEAIGRGKADNFYVRPDDVVFVPKRAY